MPVDMDKKVEIAVRLAVAGMNVRDAWTEAGKPGGEAGLQNIRKHKRKQQVRKPTRLRLLLPRRRRRLPRHRRRLPCRRVKPRSTWSTHGSARGGRASRTG